MGPHKWCGIPAFQDTSAIVSEGATTKDKDCQVFATGRFYFNRFARVMPTYYLCNALAVPLVFAGYNDGIRCVSMDANCLPAFSRYR